MNQHSSTPEDNSVTKKCISFDAKVRVRKMRHLNDFTSKEIAASWYTSKDTSNMMEDIEATIKILEIGLDVVSSNEFCERGVEYHTREGSATRHENKRRARRAVLDAQEAQREQNVSDPGALASAYQETTRDCQVRAAMIGHSDAMYVATASPFKQSKKVVDKRGAMSTKIRAGLVDLPRQRASIQSQ